jgi:hypothetical protein
MFQSKWNKTRKINVAFAILLIILVLTTIALFNRTNPDDTQPVYVGITYCGNSVEDGKLLIDKVKNYTNLFILGSGILQRDLESVNELGDYAISAGLYFLPYFGHYVKESFSVWLETAKEKWGSKFLGVYYGDEPGGKMLDSYMEFKNLTSGESVVKTMYGDVVLEQSDGVVIHYEIGGNIHLFLPILPQNPNNTETQTDVYATFYPNNTIKIEETNTTRKTIQLEVLKNYTSYEKLLEMHPMKDINQAAEYFISRNQDNVNYLSDSTTVFTSDYALYWFDYLSGYDVVLTQVGWNHTLNQQIALSRGAAKIQNKEWGVIITWKYRQPPYLADKTEILTQLCSAYECGAKYYVIFNYYESNSGPYGTMEDEHFEALQFFWNDVVENPDLTKGSTRANSILVLPKNYGWGMRRLEDRIWGIFEPDNKTEKMWTLVSQLLDKHGKNLDIVYSDPTFLVTTEYQNVYYFDQLA